ncbi:MAG: hypothetical protein CVU05_03605 [Bacteroidetes bacterium HGW-Bacteroidetes-21]|jgi:hypothetical protein|nr:MAG: hypothetical protein CVU05_03605 [Bacteroidetes bacterium HGW-Bacteroidetes-21]
MIMNKFLLLILILSNLTFQLSAQTWPASLAGRWTFDILSNPLHAETGTDLTLTGTHIATEGISPLDGAFNIGTGSYYSCQHGIAANGGGSLVNEYSILWDVKIDNPTVFHCLFQTNTANSNDGDGFINTNSQIGVSATSYSGFSLDAGQWYRIVMTVDNGSSFRYYVNGHQVMEGAVQTVDGRYSLDPALLFFADDNGEDQMISCSQLAVFGSCLTAAEVRGLGGIRSSDIKPYLQSPSPTSICVSWNAFDNGSTKIDYGTTVALGNSVTGTYEDVSSNRWHTTDLTGLTPDTRYYYRCISGSDSSEIYTFKTPFAQGSTGKHIRFIKVGDTQANAGGITGSIADSILVVLKQTYGNEWYDSLSFFMHSGDLNQSGSEIGRYMNEFFNPYSIFTPYVPMMISIGNHEAESAHYYSFVKYENLTGNNEKYYRFDLGNCCFIALNTNGLYNTATQTNWLQAQLNAAELDPSIDFVFVYNHQPARSEMWPDGNTSYVETSILPLLKSFSKVTMINWGHSHNYERGTVLSSNNKNWDFRTVLCGGAGGALDRWGMYTNQTNESNIQKTVDHYSFLLVDVDAGNVTTKAYSLGNPNCPTSPTIIDQWHRYIHQPAPNKPSALWPSATASQTPVLAASLYSGSDILMTSQFQVASISGSFNSPLSDIIRDTEDFYGDSGSPSYLPVNINSGIDLQRCPIASGILQIGQTYMWRMRYRDENARWSDWSDTLTFNVVSTPTNLADFTADITVGQVPLTVHFTDLSVYNPTSWDWDLNGDGSTDATDRDPVFVYTTPGIYNVSLTTTVNSQTITETKNLYINAQITSNHPIANQINILAYPNPSSGEITFFNHKDAELAHLEIIDICGKILYSKTYAGVKQNDILTWNGKDQTGSMIMPGVYFCRIVYDGIESVVKIIRL